MTTIHDTAPRTVATVAPQGMSAARHAKASAAADALAATIKAAKAAGDATWAKAYGPTADGSAVRLAAKAAAEYAGGTKSRGRVRADVLAIIAAMAKAKDGEVLAETFVKAARIRLDAHAAAQKTRRETKSALAATVRDSSATKAARRAALDVLTGMDDADAAAKAKTASDALAATVKRAHDGGVSFSYALDILAKAYGATVENDGAGFFIATPVEN